MIEVKQDGAMLTVTLNRLDKANALTLEMLLDLVEIYRNADAKVIILTGAGGVFSAGADLDAARAGLATSPLWEQLSGAISAHAGLTIAALNGTLAGGAFGMALACDLRIAVPNAKFFYPVMKLGFLPQPSDPARLRDLIGPARAKIILMAGQKVLADEALQWGLIDRIVAADMLLEAATALGQDVMAAAQVHAAGIKGMI